MGVARCNSLAELSETLKMFHTAGILKSNRVAIMGPSGGDMAMTGDLSEKLSINYSNISYIFIPVSVSMSMNNQVYRRVLL